MKKILTITLILFVALLITGCGSSNSITDKLNEIVKESTDKWENQGYSNTFTFSALQSSLDDKNYNYVIIASGDKEFEKAETNKKYSENLANYEGKTYSMNRMLEKELEVNYCLILDKESNKYYNVQITYKTIKLNDVEKEYPYFEKSNEVK